MPIAMVLCRMLFCWIDNITECVCILSDIMQSAYMLSIFYAENETVMLNIIMMYVIMLSDAIVGVLMQSVIMQRSLQLKKFCCIGPRWVFLKGSASLKRLQIVASVSFYSTGYAKCCYAEYRLFWKSYC